MPADGPFDPQALLDLLPSAVAVIDGSGAVVYANDTAHEQGVVGGGSVAAPQLRDQVRSVRRDGIPRTRELPLDLPGIGRRERWVAARAVPLASGHVALIVDDVTEARRVAAVRRDFVANVGHEIKTPVGAVTLLAEAALDARDDPDAMRRFVDRIGQEARRLSRLVQELIDLSRLQGGEPLPVGAVASVDRIVDEAVERARSAAELKGIEVVCGGERGLRVVGDESQLVTAVANLLDNAVAYSPNRTRVAVGVHDRDPAVEIAVSDQGIGIAADDQERIFERFYRVDPARSRETGGTGLGLAIVKHIVSNHGGAVTVWSRPGEGSTFTVRLPKAGVGSPP